MQIGDYEILEELGRGGMGVVLRARQRSLRRDVALKVLLAGAKASERQVKRFLREAGALARLQHPNIVRVYDTGEFGEHLYFTMELVEGQDLSDLVDNKRLSLRRSVEIARDVALGLQHAHEKGVIHRDIKPDNILIDPGGTPLITDFGLVRDTGLDESRLTKSGAVLGTPYYMSPEQAAGQGHHLTGAADLYSLGVMLYQMLTNELPFKAQTQIELCKMIVQDAPPRPSTHNPSVKGDLEAITLKCLEKTPERRYSTAGDLADDLDRFLRGEPVLARRRGVPPAVQLGLAAVGLALVGAGITAAIFKQRRRRPPETPVASATPTPGSSQTPAVTPALAIVGQSVPELQKEIAALPAGEEYRSKLRQLVDACSRSLGEDPQRHDVRLIRGRARAAIQRLEEASADYSQVAQEAKGAVAAEAMFLEARLKTRRGEASQAPLADRIAKWLEAHPEESPWRTLNAVLERKLRPDLTDRERRRLLEKLEALTKQEGPWQAAAWGVMGSVAFNLKQHDLTFKALNRAIELNGRSAVSWGSRASYHLIIRNDEARATSDLEQALKLDPGEPLSLQLRANIRTARRDMHGALRDLEMAYKRADDNPNLVMNIVVVMRRVDQRERAAQMLKEALRKWPGDTSVVQVGTSDALEADDFDGACAVLERGLDALQPGTEEFARIRRRYEDLVASSRKLARAERYAQSRLSKDSKDEFALALLGTVLLFRSGPQAAFDHWEPILAERPKSPVILRHLIRVKLSTAEDPEILAWAQRLRDAGPNDPEAQSFAFIAELQTKKANTLDHERRTAELAAKYAANPGALTVRAIVLANEKDIDGAMELLDRAERIEPENYQISLLKGQIQGKQGRPEAAARAFRSGLVANPFQRDLLVAYTKALRQAKDWGRLINFVGSTQERWEKLGTVNLPVSCHFDAIEALIQQGKAESAVRVLKGIHSQMPKTALGPRLEVALYLAKAGDLATARLVVKGVLQVDPNNAKARDLLERLGPG
jgi:tetratricopeptide (TPR) repeat protein